MHVSIALDILFLFTFPEGTHLVPKTSPRQRFQDVQNANLEYVHKT